MNSYFETRRSSSDCVQFVYADGVGAEDAGLREDLNRLGIKYAYVDYLEIKRNGEHIVNAIAKSLSLTHAPYMPPTEAFRIKVIVPFLDDLVGLSQKVAGVAIIIDNADIFLADDSKTMFVLIEAFLHQFSTWFEKRKPCHLCFQMERSEWPKRIFAS